MKIKSAAVGLAALAVIALSTKKAAAEGLTGGLFDRGMSFYHSACSASRFLGICTDGAAANPRSLNLAEFAGLAVARVAPPRIIQIAQLFIDNMQVGAVGNTRIKVSLELR